MDNIAPDEWQPEASIPQGPFASSEAGKAALMTFAISHGFSLVVKNSYPTGVTLLCAQGGNKRSHKAGGWAPPEGLRLLRSKKVGCAYEVKLICSVAESTWTAVQVHGIHSGHNQLTDSTIGALPSARRFLLKDGTIDHDIEAAYATGSLSSAIWSNLRAQFPWLTLKDVENVIHQMKIRQLGGMSEIESLHAKLKSKQIVSGSVRNSDNRVIHLWFAPSASATLSRRYCDVLLMDCTYKTNKHSMPLLHVVGVSGTNDTFTVACFFLPDETVASYTWAIGALKRCIPHAPGVVVVDNEKALIHALEATWTTCRVHLCVWHISRNIVSNCKADGMHAMAFEFLLKGWHCILYHASSRIDFLRQWVDLKDYLLPGSISYTTDIYAQVGEGYCSVEHIVVLVLDQIVLEVIASSYGLDSNATELLPMSHRPRISVFDAVLTLDKQKIPWIHPVIDQHTVDKLKKAFTYIESNKLPLLERFAAFSTNKFKHFGHTATSRAEGAHWANLKVHLKRSRGSLLDVYDRIDRSTENRFNALNDKMNRERTETLTLPAGMFGNVVRGITHFALKTVHNQYRKALHQIEPKCSGYYRNVMGLPCAHEIKICLQSGSCLQMHDFDIHWHKSQLGLDPDVVGVLEPLRVERTRGRPSHARSTRRELSLHEHVEQRQANKRKCGTCGQSGHNKRSCSRSTNSTMQNSTN